MQQKPNSQKSWSSGTVFYQIYTRSFQDSNNDGIGDINGIRQRLDYLNDGHGGGLGVDGLWISTVHASPMKDFGYDISDYYSIEPTYGTMTDFEDLLRDAHSRGIKIIIDLVVNHTSDQHPWFLESCRSANGPKGDWFIWRDARPDGSPPSNWISVFGGSAWQWNEQRQQYYMHSFMTEQPDLNWESPDVRQAMTQVMRFWLDKGVDGFRVDAIDFLGKNYAFPDEPPDIMYDSRKPYSRLNHIYSRDTENMYDYLRLMDSVVREYDNRFLILESFILKRNHPELYWRYYREINSPVSLPFNFELIFSEWSAKKIQSFLDSFQAGLREKDEPVFAIGNHDNPRFVSKTNRYAARSAALLLLTLPGLCFIYNGDEIGMSGTLSGSNHQDNNGRDGSRTPMQWSNYPYGGFSNVKPWLPLSKDCTTVNVDSQLNDPQSLINLYGWLISLRHRSKALRHGSYRSGPRTDQSVSFFREQDDESFLVIINCSDQSTREAFPEDYHLALSSIPQRKTFNGELAPYEGVILQREPALITQPAKQPLAQLLA